MNSILPRQSQTAESVRGRGAKDPTQCCREAQEYDILRVARRLHRPVALDGADDTTDLMAKMNNTVIIAPGMIAAKTHPTGNSQNRIWKCSRSGFEGRKA